MDEYISRSAALKAVGESSWAGFRLNEIPAADVRPVVRCKDCKHYDCEDGDMECIKDADWDEETAHYYGFVSYHNPDWFCADGERRAE